MKKCNGCNKNLPLKDFNKNKNNKDGLSYYCKICTKKYYVLSRYKNTDNEDYEKIISDEFIKNNIPIEDIDIDKIKGLKIDMIDFPGGINSSLKDLVFFCKKYNLSYEEYKMFIEECFKNNFWIKPKPLNTIKD